MLRQIVRVSLVALISLTTLYLAACGYKGPLYLPKPGAERPSSAPKTP